MKQKRIAQPSDSPPAVMPTYGPAIRRERIKQKAKKKESNKIYPKK